jgi:hypothetical protein
MKNKITLLILLFFLKLVCFSEETIDQPKALSDYEKEYYPMFQDLSVYKDHKNKLEGWKPENLSKHNRKSSRELLNEIREDPYGFGHDEPAIVLASRPDAEKLILEELKGADDYFLCSLVNILSNMPSPERDSVFKDILTKKSKPTDDFLRHSYIIPMMLCLSVSKSPDSISIISKYSRERN